MKQPQLLNNILKIRYSTLVIIVLIPMVFLTGISIFNQLKTVNDGAGILTLSNDTINAHVYSLGEEDNFKVWDFTNQELTTITATCQAIGTESYIFLDNRIPLTINYSEVSDIVDTMIMPILISNFASPPDNDNNGKVVILYTLMTGAGGYFQPYDSYGGEIVYIKGDTGTTRIDTIIHELQHLVCHGYDNKEYIWFNEGCSVFSEFLLDYEEGNTEDHILFYPHAVSLLYWDYDHASARTDYKAALTFVAYLYDQFGSQNLSAIYQAQIGNTKLHSKTAIMNIVNQYYPDLSFEQLYMNFMIANIVDTKYQGNTRSYFYENFEAYPEPVRFPVTGVSFPKLYPYNSTWTIDPWATKIYLFNDFPDPGEINVSITIPSDSQSHLFGVNIIKENRSLNFTNSNIQSFILTAENVSQGFHDTFNFTDEGFEQFYVTISHLDGGEGGYYDDIPSSEFGVEVSLKVESGTVETSSSTTTTTETISGFTINHLFLLGIAIFVVRRKK